MIKYIFGVVASAVLFASCQPKHSGPCEYFEFKAVKFRIADITPIEGEPDNFDIWIQFEESSLAEEKQNLGKLKGMRTDAKFIDKNYIETGLIYNADVSELKPGTGNCEPLIIGWNNKFRPAH